MYTATWVHCEREEGRNRGERKKILIICVYSQYRDMPRIIQQHEDDVFAQ